MYFFTIESILREKLFEVVDEIWLTELPDVDKIHKKCLEIYLCREMKCFELEDAILEEVIFIMRSSEIIIRLTRHKDNNYRKMLIVTIG